MRPWTPIIIAAVGWGASGVFARAAILRGVDGATVVPLRMLFAMASLLVIVAFSKRFRRQSALAWKRGLVLGTVGMAIPMTLMTIALEDLPLTLNGVMIALIPLATIGAAHFVVPGERFSAKTLPGLALAVLGSVVLIGIGGDDAEGVGNLTRGVSLMVAGVIIGGFGGALARRFALEVPSEQLVLPQFTVNTLVVWALAPFLFGVDFADVDAVSWVLMAAIGVFGTTMAFGAFLIAAGINPTARLALVGYAVPIVAVTLAVIFLGESLSVAIVAGAALIIGGVLLADRPVRHTPSPGVTTSR